MQVNQADDSIICRSAMNPKIRRNCEVFTSKKWRELINLPAMLRMALQAGKVWEAEPLLCPKCQKEMRIVALIDDRDVIERILRHLGMWEQGVRVTSARARLRLWTGSSSHGSMTHSRTTTPSRPAVSLPNRS